jgi:AbrB family looped-hinge helix DNA binding protein
LLVDKRKLFKLVGIIMGMGTNMGKEVEIEERGRVLIPKEIREEMRLKTGQKLSVEKRGEEIVIKPSVDSRKFVSELKGCVKKSRIKPMEVKKIWEKA